jgi:hypothetical protein
MFKQVMKQMAPESDAPELKDQHILKLQAEVEPIMKKYQDQETIITDLHK